MCAGLLQSEWTMHSGHRTSTFVLSMCMCAPMYPDDLPTIYCNASPRIWLTHKCTSLHIGRKLALTCLPSTSTQIHRQQQKAQVGHSDYLVWLFRVVHRAPVIHDMQMTCICGIQCTRSHSIHPFVIGAPHTHTKTGLSLCSVCQYGVICWWHNWRRRCRQRWQLLGTDIRQNGLPLRYTIKE